MLRDYFDAVTLYQIVIEGRCPYPRNGHDYVVLTPGEHAALAEGTPTEE